MIINSPEHGLAADASLERGGGGRFIRSARSIRAPEVLVLQGTLLFGILFSIGPLSAQKLTAAALMVAASCCLIAHVFVFNDWAGITGDLRDPHRAKHTFATHGVSRNDVGYLAGLLAVAGLALLIPLGLGSVALGLGVIACSALYSAPALHFKGVPVASSILHIVGGALHFLLGYALYAPLDVRGLTIGTFFALTFAAGHLTHEARDWEGDRLNGIRTNAVQFGRRTCVLASVTLFALAYILLVWLAWSGAIPRPIAWSALLFPVQLFWTYRALKAELSFASLERLQTRYRTLFLIIGGIMAVSLLPTLIP